MEAEITGIRQILNEDFSINSYEIVVDTSERPNLKLGKCIIKQEEK